MYVCVHDVRVHVYVCACVCLHACAHDAHLEEIGLLEVAVDKQHVELVAQSQVHHLHTQTHAHRANAHTQHGERHTHG